MLITDHGIFYDDPNTLFLANFVALISGTIWLLACSAYGLPVSTTHTVVGCLVGVGLATGDMSIIDWKYIYTTIFYWILSPLLAMILGCVLFVTVRHFILRNEFPLKVVGIYLWVCTFCLCTVFALFFIFKNPSTKKFASDNVGEALGIGLAVGFGGMLILTPLFGWIGHNSWQGKAELPLSYRMTAFTCFLKTPEQRSLIKTKQAIVSSSTKTASEENMTMSSLEENDAKVHKKSDSSSSDNGVSKLGTRLNFSIKTSTRLQLNEIDELGAGEQDYSGVKGKIKKKWRNMPWFIDLGKDALMDDLVAAAQDEKAEKFDKNVEKYFASLQILSAIVSCIVHGSNDVANAVAPFGSMYAMYVNNGMEMDGYESPEWILALGGCSIALGVLFLGHKVIQNIGMKLVKITPARGFCIELSMATVMVIGSMAGMPLSSTHCQVGSTIGVGLVDKHSDLIKSKRNLYGFINTKAVNGKLILKIIVAWIATLLCSAGLSAMIFCFGAYSPYIPLD